VPLLFSGIFSLIHRSELTRASLRWLKYALVLELVLVVAAAAWGIIYERSSSARERRLHPAPGKLVDLGGYRLHLYCTGNGSPTVVLDHGLSASYAAWHSVQPRVEQFTRVCSFDRAGNGWSDRSPRPRVPEIMSTELQALLQSAGEKPPFVLVGHSAGALDIIAFARSYREQVIGLVLVDGSHPNQPLPFPFSDKLSIRWLQWSAPFGLPRWRRWCEDGVKEISPLKRGFSCDARVFQTQYDEWSVLARPAKDSRPLETLGDLPLVVISRDPNLSSGDKIGSDSWAGMQRDLLRLSSRASQIIATGSGHAINIDRPDLVIQVIRDVVEQSRSSPFNS